MIFRQIMEIHQFCWSLESNAQQRLAWEDAALSRIARDRAERQAAAQAEAMLQANPSGSLGHAAIDDMDALRKSGLL